MESIGVGAGLGAIGFWGFVAIVVVAGIWNGIRKREAQHETLRRMVDSGRAIDPGLMNKLLSASENGSGENLGRDLKISGLIVIFIAPGLAVMGWFLAQLYQRRKILTRKGFPFWAGCDSRLAKEIRHVSMHCSSGRLRQH